jgi:hypothetical protein
LTNFLEYLFEFVLVYDGIFIHFNEEIVNFFNSMIISKWRPYDFRGEGVYFWIKLNIFVFFAVNYLFFRQSPVPRVHVICSGLKILSWLDDPARRIDQGYVFRVYIRTFLFEFSKVNIFKINLTKIFLLYALVNHIRIFQPQFLIYATVNHIRILQRHSGDGSCFYSAQNLTWRIFLIKNRYFFPE